jgi:uncharacterized protein
MSTALQRIRVLSDGRAGHVNQSRGLAEALARRTGAEIETVELDAKSPVWSRVKKACAAGAQPPQLIIAAGHRMHLPLLCAARKFKSKSVVVMKPSLPAGWFDLCLVPRHDLRTEARWPVVSTLGALNRLPETHRPKREAGVVLIGGPSSHHGWDGPVLADAIRNVVDASPQLDWTVADSRRTPEGFLSGLEPGDVRVNKVEHQTTQPGWLPSILSEAREVWVSEDSTSMIFEALTAGARVGLLPMPFNGRSQRLKKALDALRQEGRAVHYADWSAGKPLPESDEPFHEAGRCADIVLKRLFAGEIA